MLIKSLFVVFVSNNHKEIEASLKNAAMKPCYPVLHDGLTSSVRILANPISLLMAKPCVVAVNVLAQTHCI